MARSHKIAQNLIIAGTPIPTVLIEPSSYMVALQIFRSQVWAAMARVTDLGHVARILVRVHYYPPFLNSLEVRTALMNSEGEATPYSKLRPRRGPSRESRSPSPSAPPISGALAVIKAQAFGALRRTRIGTKKTSEGAA
jgi:hypothetical protein